MENPVDPVLGYHTSKERQPATVPELSNDESHQLLYEKLNVLLPTITNIMNTFLAFSVVPPDLKTAIVKPLLNKPSLDKKSY